MGGNNENQGCDIVSEPWDNDFPVCDNDLESLYIEFDGRYNDFSAGDIGLGGGDIDLPDRDNDLPGLYIERTGSPNGANSRTSVRPNEPAKGGSPRSCRPSR